MATHEIWIVGGTGRIGRAVAQRLDRHGDFPLVLVGRNRQRLDVVAGSLTRPARTLVSDSPTAIAGLVADRKPAVVVNTLGSYATSAVTIARACMPGGHYVDLANDLTSIPTVLALHDEAAAAGSTLVTGAGFGVLGTESAVAKLCEGRAAPRSVRVDALASVGIESGKMGVALAASIIDVLAGGGKRYRDGRLVSAGLGSPALSVTTPDGSHVTSAGAPSGELVAARTASGAPDVVATSAIVPASRLIRAALPAARYALKIPPVRRRLLNRLAAVHAKAAPRPRPHSWGHAVAEWSDGSRHECWLRAGDGMDFTADAATAVALGLAHGEAPAGAYTPVGAFGPEIAGKAGGVFIPG